MNEESIFLAATQLSEPHRRAEYLAHACAGDSALQHRLQERLAAHDRANDSANVVHVEHGRPGDFDALGTQIVPSAGELPGYAVGEGTRVVLTSGEPEPPDSSPLHRDDPHQGEHDATRIVMIRCETPERRDDEPGEHAATHVALPIEVSSVYSLGEGTRVELRAAEPPEYSDTSQTWISQRQGGADRELSEDLEFNESLSNRPIDLAYLAPSSKPGSLGRLGHYEVDAVLGRGGCGVVLKAFDEKLHRTVAIKVIAPELAGSSPARKRFLREARAAAAVRHENVVTVYAVEEQPIAYQVMEFINGRTLQQRLDQTGPIEAVEALNLAVQLGQGLAAAHAQGLIHRDIKPANILQEHGGERVKVTDFGLARTADDASVTQSGVIAGTPLYMSPEQAAGTAIDARSDLFSLGSVLYALYCGHPPFRAATTLAVLARVVNDQPRPIRQVYPDAPEWLIALIGRLHAKHPDERFQSARELAEAALRIQEHLLRYGRVDPQDETLRRLLNPARPASVESLPTDSATLGSASNPASASTSTSTASSALAGLGAIFGAAALGAAVAVGVLIVFNAGPFSRRADENALRIAQMDASGSRGPNASRGAHPSNEKAFPPALGAGTDVGPAGASAPTAPRQAAESAGSELTAAASTSPGGATSVGPETPAAPSPAVVDRRAAEYALSLGCEVTLKFDEGPPATVRELPNVPFSLVGLRLNSRATDEGMAALAGCRNLERVHFVQSPISEQGLSALRDCADLQELYLIGANVGSEATAILAKHKKLARVCVFGCPLDDESLARLKYLPLTELNIGHTLATDATLRAFSGSRVLRNLNASYTTITDAGLAALRECDLTELALDQTAVTDAGLAHFSDCLGLELLSLRGTAVTDAGLAPFIACRSLKRLVTVGTKVTPERLAEFQAALPECVIESEVMRRPSSDPNRLGAEYVFSLAGRVKLVGRSGFVHSLDELPDEPFELSEIWLNQRPVTDTGMAAFRGCKSLTALVLINAPVTNAALANFSECDGLEQLIVSHSRLAPGAFAPFERLDRLTHFIAWSTHLADADFKALAQSPLIELNVGGTPLTDAGLAHLERLDDLSSINARYTSLTFEGAPRFSDCRKIDRLWLDSSHVTDAGLARFQNSPALTILTLDNTPITDAGLAPFKACPLLRRLHVKRTRVSPEMIAEFHKAIPACTIEHDGGVIVGDDPQRRAAEHALALGGAVRLAEMDHELRAPEPLPDGLITLTEVALDSAPTDEAALAPFKKVPSLRKLSVKSTPVSPAVLAELKAALPGCEFEFAAGLAAPGR